MVAFWPGNEAPLFSKLNPYEVGLSFILLRFAEDQGEQMVFMDILLGELKKATPGNLKTLANLRHELCQSDEGMEAWEAVQAGLLALDSPDALFELLRNLESVICRELVSASVMHSSGAFGQLARRLVLAFKQSSFEEIIKVYDAVREFTDKNDADCITSSPRKDPCGFSKDLESALNELPLGGHLPSSKGLESLYEQKLPAAQVTFLRYVDSERHRFADSAAYLLRSFHDSQRSRALESDCEASGIQNAVLALANLSLEMSNVDDALQALEDSIRAAQESSDANCLCAGLYLLSLILSRCKLPSTAATLLRRCLHRSEALGLPLLECLSCLALARLLAARNRNFAAGPLEDSLPDKGQHASSSPSRAWTYLGKVGAHRFGNGFGVLGALSAPGREVLAHVTLASLLSTQAGSLELLRPKVLLCQAGISQTFALSSSAMCCRIVLEIYKDKLSADDRAMALCQLAENESQAEALKLAQDLPSRHHWMHVIGPKLGQHLLQSGQTAASSALLFQIAGMLGAADSPDARLRFQKFSHSCRRHGGHLLAAYQSAREALGKDGKATPELCESLLALTQVLEVNPVRALASCVRCVSIAEAARLQLRGEALLHLARLKLELGDVLGALQLAEDASSACGAQEGEGLQLWAESAMLEADCLLELSSRSASRSASSSRPLEAVVERLASAEKHFTALGLQSSLQRCHYLMARTCHELGRLTQRDRHARELRRLVEPVQTGSAFYPAI